MEISNCRIYWWCESNDQQREASSPPDNFTASVFSSLLQFYWQHSEEMLSPDQNHTYEQIERLHSSFLIFSCHKYPIEQINIQQLFLWKGKVQPQRVIRWFTYIKWSRHKYEIYWKRKGIFTFSWTVISEQSWQSREVCYNVLTRIKMEVLKAYIRGNSQGIY